MRMLWKFLPLTLVCLFFVSSAWAEPISSAQLDQILGGSLGSAAPKDIDDAAAQKVMDGYANTETAGLGRGQADWNKSNPNWKIVHDRIVTDLSAGLPAALAAQRAALPVMQQTFRSSLTAQLQQSDGDAILAYYNSPEGVRYKEFDKRVLPLMASGMAFMTPDPEHPPAKFTAEQLAKYTELIQAGSAFQMAEAKINSTPGAQQGKVIMGFMINAAAMKNGPEVVSLYQEYAKDLPSFEEFNKSAAAQHLFAAFNTASTQMNVRSMPFVKWLETTTTQHQAEWQALYQKTTGAAGTAGKP